eukprot:357080-Chlamydomonas_euryale.AAC.5
MHPVFPGRPQAEPCFFCMRCCTVHHMQDSLFRMADTVCGGGKQGGGFEGMRAGGQKEPRPARITLGAGAKTSQRRPPRTPPSPSQAATRSPGRRRQPARPSQTQKTSAAVCETPPALPQSSPHARRLGPRCRGAARPPC